MASPGDVMGERDIAREVCEDLSKNPMLSEKIHLSFQATGWEDVFPEAGRPQEIINRLVDECDLFICLFHERFGTPSGVEESGTLEEFLLAHDQWKEELQPHIMVYFKDVVMTPKKLKDPQVLKVFEFREKIETERLLLFDTFATTDQFRTKFKTHLERWIAKNATKFMDAAEPDEKTPMKRRDIGHTSGGEEKKPDPETLENRYFRYLKEKHSLMSFKGLSEGSCWPSL